VRADLRRTEDQSRAGGRVGRRTQNCVWINLARAALLTGTVRRRGAEMRTYHAARRAHRCDAHPGSWLGRGTVRRAVGPLLERVRPRRAGTGRSPSAPSRTVSTSRSRKRHVRPCVVFWACPIVATTGRGGGVAWAGQGCRLEADVLVRAIRQTSPEPSRRIGRGPR